MRGGESFSEDSRINSANRPITFLEIKNEGFRGKEKLVRTKTKKLL